MGAEIVALSADTPELARMTVSELGITYPILSDSSRTHIRAYDVLHPQEGIARPSVFVLDRDGVIRWRHVGMSNYAHFSRTGFITSGWTAAKCGMSCARPAQLVVRSSRSGHRSSPRTNAVYGLAPDIPHHAAVHPRASGVGFWSQP